MQICAMLYTKKLSLIGCTVLRMASIKQYRGKTWRAIIRRKGFAPQSQTFESKKDAVEWATAIEARMGVSRFDPLQLQHAKTTTVKDLFERYEREVAVSMRGRNEVATVKRLIRDAPFMRMLASKLTPQDIRQWRDARVKEVQPQSVHREMNTLSGVISHAIEEWSAPISINPCYAVSRFKGADRPRDKRWSEVDTRAFLTAAGWQEGATPSTGRDYVGWALLLGIETAMREGELCSLTVADFRPADKCAYLSMTKNGEARSVPLSVKAMQYLAFLCQGKSLGDKIIPLKANTLCEYVLDVRRKCGLEHLVFHDTRHEATTRIAAKLTNVLELSAVTGHKSLKHLKRYYNPIPADIAGRLG